MSRFTYQKIDVGKEVRKEFLKYFELVFLKHFFSENFWYRHTKAYMMLVKNLFSP